ncbi:MAG: cupin domain-containing protein [bacterium]|nr:cupin domain-containing protein [bacterium]
MGRALGLERMGINHETLEPGGRSSMPHAHSHEEEFVYVLAGTPTLWLDGYVQRLEPGDCVAFPAGTGIAHTFLNDSGRPVQLLIVGLRDPEDGLFYPLNPERAHPRLWTDPPERGLGPHDGRARVSA